MSLTRESYQSVIAVKCLIATEYIFLFLTSLNLPISSLLQT